MTSAEDVKEEETLRDIIRTRWTSSSYTRQYQWTEDDNANVKTAEPAPKTQPIKVYYPADHLNRRLDHSPPPRFRSRR